MTEFEYDPIRLAYVADPFNMNADDRAWVSHMGKYAHDLEVCTMVEINLVHTTPDAQIVYDEPYQHYCLLDMVRDPKDFAIMACPTSSDTELYEVCITHQWTRRVEK